MLTDEELAAIRARADAGLPGPWDHNCYSSVTAQVPHGHPWDACDGDGPENDGKCSAVVCWIAQRPDQQRGDLLHSEDARAHREFIAHARADVPRLLDEIARLREAIVDLVDGLLEIADARLSACEAERDALRLVLQGIGRNQSQNVCISGALSFGPHQSAGKGDV